MKGLPNKLDIILLTCNRARQTGPGLVPVPSPVTFATLQLRPTKIGFVFIYSVDLYAGLMSVKLKQCFVIGGAWFGRRSPINPPSSAISQSTISQNCHHHRRHYCPHHCYGTLLYAFIGFSITSRTDVPIL